MQKKMVSQLKNSFEKNSLLMRNNSLVVLESAVSTNASEFYRVAINEK